MYSLAGNKNRLLCWWPEARDLQVKMKVSEPANHPTRRQNTRLNEHRKSVQALAFKLAISEQVKSKRHCISCPSAKIFGQQNHLLREAIYINQHQPAMSHDQG